MNDDVLKMCLSELSEIYDDIEAAWEEENSFQLNGDKVESAQTRVAELCCKLTSHDFGFDQCGYWQHQFCYKCRKPKYPDLIVRSCSDLFDEMGDLTEEQYLACDPNEPDPPRPPIDKPE